MLPPRSSFRSSARRTVRLTALAAAFLLGATLRAHAAEKSSPASSRSPAAAPSAAPAPPPTSSPVAVPAKNWVLPLFTPKEGHRSMTLRGSEVRPVGPTRIDVTDLNITAFAGDAAATIENILLSPAASFFPKERRATGEKSVRLIRDDIELTGEGWTYDHDGKKVSLARNVRVVFRAQLNDILK